MMMEKHSAEKTVEYVAESLAESVSVERLDMEFALPQDGSCGAWTTVLGSWLVLFGSLGNIYSFGVYQDFYTRFFLTSFSPSSIGWMGSIQITMPFIVSLISGKCLDTGYFHQVVILGSIIFSFSLFMLSLAHEGQYYQVFLSQGLGIGLGAGLIFAPACSVVTLHFKNRAHRHLAYGVALSGIAFGAVVIPILLNHLIPRIGFSGAVRVIGYMTLGCFVAGNGLMRVPGALKGQRSASVIDIRGFFRDPAYCMLIIGSAFALLVVYFPSIYLQLYSIEHHIDTQLAFYSVAIVNGSGIIGRIAANHLADVYGVWNLQVFTTLMTGVAIWTMVKINTGGALIAVAIFYGIFSGAWFSLTMAALASLSPNSHEIGARTGIAMAIASVGLLGSIPLQGALLTAKMAWIRPISFCGSVMFLAAVFSAAIRMIISRRKGSQRV